MLCALEVLPEELLAQALPPPGEAHGCVFSVLVQPWAVWIGIWFSLILIEQKAPVGLLVEWSHHKLEENEGMILNFQKDDTVWLR